MCLQYKCWCPWGIFDNLQNWSKNEKYGNISKSKRIIFLKLIITKIGKKIGMYILFNLIQLIQKGKNPNQLKYLEVSSIIFLISDFYLLNFFLVILISCFKKSIILERSFQPNQLKKKILFQFKLLVNNFFLTKKN